MKIHMGEITSTKNRSVTLMQLLASYIKQAILYIFVAVCVGVSASSDEKRLFEDLFRSYRKDVRPVLHDNHTVTVKIKHTLSQILDVNERKELFMTTGWSSLRWRDAYLSWSPERYNGIKSINIIPDKIWVPDILLYNDMESDKSFESHMAQVESRLTVNYHGNVVWGLKAKFVTKCHFDIYYFPFDVQTCPLRYGSWSYEKGRLDISEDSKMEMDQHASHNGWHILSQSALIVRKVYSKVTYESADFSITFKRRTSLGSVNLILPPLIINILVLLSFVLPAASGERLALSITLLLALIFFLLNVTFLIPKDNVTVPIIYKFFIAILTQTVLLIVCLIFGMQYYHKTKYDRPMSQWMRALFLDRLAYFMGAHVEQGVTQSGPHNKRGRVHSDAESMMEVGLLPFDEQIVLREWRIVAMTLDRCFLVFFTSMWVMTLFTFFVKFFYTNNAFDLEEHR